MDDDCYFIRLKIIFPVFDGSFPGVDANELTLIHYLRHLGLKNLDTWTKNPRIFSVVDNLVELLLTKLTSTHRAFSKVSPDATQNYIPTTIPSHRSFHTRK